MKKNLILALLALSIVACSSTKKPSADAEKAKIEAQKEAAAQVEMFSVKVEEINKADSKPQVVFFDTNSSKLTQEATITLKDKVLPFATDSKTKRVVIEAHCDERGSKSYNQRLSEKRAKAVKEFLVQNGVKSAKIKTKGYGESKPAVLGNNEEAWAKNRRAVTVSLKK